MEPVAAIGHGGTLARAIGLSRSDWGRQRTYQILKTGRYALIDVDLCRVGNPHLQATIRSFEDGSRRCHSRGFTLATLGNLHQGLDRCKGRRLQPRRGSFHRFKSRRSILFLEARIVQPARRCG